jgi:hypothetical protein
VVLQELLDLLPELRILQRGVPTSLTLEDRTATARPRSAHFPPRHGAPHVPAFIARPAAISATLRLALWPTFKRAIIHAAFAHATFFRLTTPIPPAIIRPTVTASLGFAPTHVGPLPTFLRPKLRSAFRPIHARSPIRPPFRPLILCRGRAAHAKPHQQPRHPLPT